MRTRAKGARRKAKADRRAQEGIGASRTREEAFAKRTKEDKRRGKQKD